MATNDQYRVTKDTSARKQPNTVPAFEVTAMKAAHEAYLKSMMHDYDEKIEHLEAAHEEELNAAKSQLEEIKSAFQQEQKAAIDGAVTKAVSESRSQITQLTHNNASLTTKTEEMKTFVDEVLAENKQLVVSAQLKIGNINENHAKEIAKLQRKLEIGPNSWVECTIQGKGRKSRDYVRRLQSTFHELVNEYFTQAATPPKTHSFEHKGRTIHTWNWSKTLQELGVKNKDIISMTY